MSDELQNDNTEVIESNEPEVIENPTGSELATETETTEGGNAEKTEVTEEEKAVKRQEAFNKQYGATKQAERERDAAKAEIEQLRQAQYQPPPKVGKYPQEFDFDTTEEFNQAKANFLNNVTANANHDAQQQVFQNQQIATQQEAQRQQAQKIQEDLISYTDKAEKVGIDKQELNQVANIVKSYGISDDLTLAILSDPEGPLLTKYLAGNPVELDALNRMSPMQAAMHIERVLKPKAVELKPKTSNAPSPSADIKGNGVSPNAGKYKHIGGAVFS